MHTFFKLINDVYFFSINQQCLLFLDAGLTRQLGHGHLPVGLHNHLKKKNSSQFQNKTLWKLNLLSCCSAWPAINRQSSIRQELVTIYNEKKLWSALLAFLEWNRYKVADSPTPRLGCPTFQESMHRRNSKRSQEKDSSCLLVLEYLW